MRGRFVFLIIAAVVGLVACGGGDVALTPQDVIDSFEAAGLEVGDYQEATADDYGIMPIEPEAGIRFFIPSLGENSGGRVMSFSDVDERDAAREYYVALGEGNALFASHTFVRDNILVQINGELDEAIAAEYEAALNAAGE